MSDEKIRGFCKDCNKFIVAFRSKPNHVLHLLLSIFTFGLWVFVWIGLSIKIGGWKCSECGSKRISQTTSTFAKVLLILVVFFVMTVIISAIKQRSDKKALAGQSVENTVQTTSIQSKEPVEIPVEKAIEIPIESSIDKEAQAEQIQQSKPEPATTTTSQNKTWAGDWGNGIIATVSSEPCQNRELVNQDYDYLMTVTIPVARLKSPDDAWRVLGDKAVTIMGCWSKRDFNMIHAKLTRKKGNKTWEQDFKLDDGNWINRADGKSTPEKLQAKINESKNREVEQVKSQPETHQAVIENSCDSILTKQKEIYADKYPNNFSMQKTLVEDQCKSYLFLQSFTSVAGIPDSKITELKQIYAGKYPNNYSMQKVLVEDQVKSYLELHK